MDIAAAVTTRSVASDHCASAPLYAVKVPLSPPSRIAAMHYQLTPTKLSLPPLADVIRAVSATPQFALTKKLKGSVFSSRVARRIMQDDRVRRSRLVFDFSEEEMAQYFHLPQRVAAKRLGVAVITLKRNCKRRGMKWPYRSDKLRQIQQTKSRKLPRSSHSVQPSSPLAVSRSAVTMSPMLLLSEAARAYSRLPVECMSENVPLLAASTLLSRW